MDHIGTFIYGHCTIIYGNTIIVYGHMTFMKGGNIINNGHRMMVPISSGRPKSYRLAEAKLSRVLYQYYVIFRIEGFLT